MQTKQNNSIYFIDLILYFKDIFIFLLHRWMTIFLFALLCGILGITYAWLSKPIYKANLKFSYESGGDNKLGSYAGIAAQFGFDLGGTATSGAFLGDNLIEFLKTRTIVEETLLTPAPYPNNNKLMIDLYLTNHKLNKNWSEDTLLSKIKFKANQPPQRAKDSVMGKVYDAIIKKQLEIEKIDKKLSFVVITMRDSDELFAKNFVELLTDNAIKNFVNYRLQKSRKNLEIVQQQVDSVRGVLFGGISAVAARNDLNINPSKQVLRTSVQKKQVDIQTATIVYGELLKNMEIAKLTLQKETPLIQIIDKPIFPLEKKKPGRLLSAIVFAFIGTIGISLFLIFKKLLKKGIEYRKQNIVINNE